MGSSRPWARMNEPHPHILQGARDTYVVWDTYVTCDTVSVYPHPPAYTLR
jgi:hypothetical protein